MTGAMCDDNRFELIEKYKNKLIDGTNIETSKDEMAVIESILFRFWQMGWLDKLEEFDRQKAEIENLQHIVHVSDENQDELIKTISQRDAEIERLEEKSRIDDKLLNDRVQEAVASVSKANQKYVDALEKAFNDKVAELKTAKSEAIKEFAEGLKERAIYIPPIGDRYGVDVVFIEDIDYLVKEMVGERYGS